MSVRLTETRLRQIIREEAKRWLGPTRYPDMVKRDHWYDPGTWGWGGEPPPEGADPYEWDKAKHDRAMASRRSRDTPWTDKSGKEWTWEAADDALVDWAHKKHDVFRWGDSESRPGKMACIMLVRKFIKQMGWEGLVPDRWKEDARGILQSATIPGYTQWS